LCYGQHYCGPINGLRLRLLYLLSTAEFKSPVQDNYSSLAVNYFCYLLPDHDRFIAGKTNIPRKQCCAQGHDGGSTSCLLKFIVMNYEIAPPLEDWSAHFQHVYTLGVTAHLRTVLTVTDIT
jgi:hypothetical protein